MNPFQDVFISYGRADSKLFAKRLNDRLVALGYTVWFDFDDIPLGVDYQKQIDDGIEKADNFLFIISPHSVNSDYCRLEIARALQHRKRIIALLHVERISRDTWQQRNPGGTDADWAAYTAAGKHDHFANMHPEIRKINWVNGREGLDDFETSLQGLVGLIERQRDYVHQHTVLLNGALAWERNQKRTRYLLIGEERQQAEAWLAQRFTESQPPCLPTDLHCEFITESIKNANNLMTEVFLSHAEEDRDITEQIRRTLMRNGITTWTYRTDIEYGSDFQSAIARGIEEADNILLMLSPATLQSAYCQQELDLALQLHKRIIVILVAAVEASQFPAALQNRQYINLTDNQTPTDLLQDEAGLLRLLKQGAAYHHKHKVLLTKALKWERQQRHPCILLRGYELQHALAWLKLAQQFQPHGPIPLLREFIATSERQPPGLTLDVFISYSRADSDFARKVNDGLQRQGKRTWFDQESIASGTDFQQEIYRGIASSDHFLFILSPRSVKSPYCADEVEYAAKLNKRIVTVRYRAVEAADVHRELAKVHWVDFLANEGDFAANFQELIRTLDDAPEHRRFHTHLLMQAIAWDEKNRRESLLLRGAELAEAEQWLLQAAGKHPGPTTLHGDYVATSRRSASSQQWRLIGILGSLLAVAVLAAGFAGIQYRVARANEAEADQRRGEAEEAQAEAEIEREKADEARQDAEAQRAIALTEQAKAEAALTQAEAAQVAEAEQRRRAEAEEIEARRQAAIAKQQEQIAKAQEAAANQQREIAEAQTEIAQAQEAAAKTQQQIALGRQLTAQAEAFRQKLDQSPRSTLLSIAAIRRLQAQSVSIADANKVLNDLRLIPLVPSRGFQPYAANKAGFSPDGRYLVITEANHTVLWNLETDRKKRLPVQTVDDLTFSLNGHQVAIQSGGRWIVWDIEGDRTLPLPVQENILGVHFSPNGQFVGIRSGAGVILWHLATDQQEVISEQSVDGLRFSPDSRYMAFRDQDGAFLWNLNSRQKASLIGEKVDDLSFSPDNRYIGIFGEFGAKLWEIQTQQSLPLPGSAINDLTFSPNGQYLGIRSEAGEVVWDVQAAQVLPLPEKNVNSLSFSPDGQHVGIRSDAGATLWNMKTNRQWQLSSGNIQDLVFNSDGRYLGTISEQTTGQIWDIATQREVTRVIHEGQIAQLSFSPNSQYVIAGGWDQTIQVAAVLQQQNITHVVHHAGGRQLAFSPNGHYVVINAGNNSLQIWDIEENSVVARIPNDESINRPIFSPDSRHLVLHSGGGASIWNLAANRAWSLSEAPINFLSFSPTGHYLATYGEAGSQIWDTRTNQPVPLPVEDVIELFFSPEEGIAIAKTPHNAVLWHLDHPAVKTTLQVTNISSVQFSPSGRYVAIAGDDRLLWDISANRAVPLPDLENISSLFWGTDDRTLGITTATTNFLWDIPTQQQTLLSVDRVYDLSFSPDGRRVAIESDTGWTLWDRQTRQAVSLPMTGIKSLVFNTSRSGTAAGQYIGMVGDAGAMVWDIATQTAYSLPIDRIDGLAVSPDGRTLAIHSQSAAIAWDLQTRQTIIQVPHNEGIQSVGFSATGQYFLTQGERSAGAWLLDAEALISQSCNRLTRNLTEQEWQQYVSDREPYQAICPLSELAHSAANASNPYQPIQPLTRLMHRTAELFSTPFARMFQHDARLRPR